MDGRSVLKMEEEPVKLLKDGVTWGWRRVEEPCGWPKINFGL